MPGNNSQNGIYIWILVHGLEEEKHRRWWDQGKTQKIL